MATIWQEMNQAGGDFSVTFCDPVAVVFDGEHVWLTDVDRLLGSIVWATITPADDHFAHEPYAAFWGHCHGWVVTDIKPGDDFGLCPKRCVIALQTAGYHELIPPHWWEVVMAG